MRNKAQLLLNHLRGRRAFQSFRDQVLYGRWEKKLKSFRALFVIQARIKRVREQRNFEFTAMAYHDAASVLNALRRWKYRARKLARIRTKTDLSWNHKRHRSLHYAMYKFRMVSFATDFAVSMHKRREAEEEDQYYTFFRSNHREHGHGHNHSHNHSSSNSRMAIGDLQ